MIRGWGLQAPTPNGMGVLSSQGLQAPPTPNGMGVLSSQGLQAPHPPWYGGGRSFKLKDFNEILATGLLQRHTHVEKSGQRIPNKKRSFRCAFLILETIPTKKTIETQRFSMVSRHVLHANQTNQKT